MSALTVALPTLLWQWLLACLGCVLAGLHQQAGQHAAEAGQQPLP